VTKHATIHVFIAEKATGDEGTAPTRRPFLPTVKRDVELFRSVRRFIRSTFEVSRTIAKPFIQRSCYGLSRISSGYEAA
jgi:hypothetical protein